MIEIRFGLSSLVILLSLSASTASAADCTGVAPDVAPIDANQKMGAVVPKYDWSNVSSTLAAQGWQCRDYDLKTGLTCTGHLPGFSGEVAIIVPARYRPRENANLIMHLNGNWGGGTLDGLLKSNGFADILAESRRSDIMVIPYSHGKVDTDNHSEMRDSARFQRIMDGLMTTLQSSGLAKSAAPGQITLSGHSVAYFPIASILSQGCLKGHTCYQSHIHEVDLFDATYAYPKTFAKFAAVSGHRFTSTFQTGGKTAAGSKAIIQSVADERANDPEAPTDLPPVLPANVGLDEIAKQNPAFIQTPAGHEQIVNQYMQRVLDSDGAGPVEDNAK